ncbi:MAG: PKD domain-containing protein [candidate division SR1 bacterium]|nr:PKD domain-containing protein [candidate division SR1 bacterium]
MVDQIPQTNIPAPQMGNPPPPVPQQMPQTPLQATPMQQAPVRSANVTKPTSKISMKGVLIGCGILFMFVIGGLSLVFYNLMNNPSQLSSVGLDPTTTKILLQTFSVIFFGLLTFLGVGLLIVNLYRIITVKNKSKVGNIFGAFLGFIVFIFAIVLGAKVITMINNFSVDNILDSDKLIMPYLQVKDGTKYTRGDATMKLIAPATIFYTLNNTYFNSQIIPQLGQVNFTEVFLDCGNGQKLKLNFTTSQFDGSCIYFKKGEYLLNLETRYINIPTSEKIQKTFTGGSIIFDSEISVSPTKSDLTFNDAKTEMILGKAPSKVMFDASSVFKDLGLSDYKIIWDFNGDGTQDKQNIVATTFVYNEAKLYNVYIRFPALNNYIYTFPVRVEQSDVPVCEVIVTKADGKNYTVTTNFFDKTVKIVNYQFDVLNRNDKSIDTIKNNNGTFSYQFPGAGLYAIQNTFITEDDKQGQCESDDVQVGVTDFQVNYDRYFKSPQSPQFQKITNQGIASLVSGEIILTEIPTVIKLQVNQISPNTPTATKRVLVDGKQVISIDQNSFEFTIDNNASHEVTLIIEDVPSGAKTEIIIPVRVNRADVIGKLIVTPDTVGTDPFTVKFDASTTILNDTGDEIVSFTWDFGDGTGSIKKDFSEAFISHTYRYDTKNNNGTYHPIVLIKTKKGREVSVSPATDIIVKRANQTLNISIPDYPAQQANVGDRVGFSIEFNGLPTQISRDFGDGKTLTCNTRQECGSTTHIYTNAGTYPIRAAISYSDQPTIDGTITLKIK